MCPTTHWFTAKPTDRTRPSRRRTRPQRRCQSRDLLERHPERVTLTPNPLELPPRQIIEPAKPHTPATPPAGRLSASVTTMAVPWPSPAPAAVKGIIRVPAHNTPIKASRREALLIAIAKARQWIDDLAHG